jgi:KAP family P-loop domain
VIAISQSKITGHDAALSRRVDDLYERYPVAESIYRICRYTPVSYSTRIGLYGAWGSGKTSVLNFIEEIAKPNGDVIVRFSASRAVDLDSLWEAFHEAFVTAAKSCGVDEALSDQASGFAKKHSEKVPAVIKVAARTVQVFTGLPMSSEGIDKFAEEAGKLAGKKKNDKKLIEKLQTKMAADSNRRIIVFVDDLDRAAPNVVPALLLTLRELFDIPGFCFVIAFDFEVVTRALGAYNKAWEGRSEQFLEKVVDFPVHLPDPSSLQIRDLMVQEMKLCCPEIPEVIIDEVLAELPVNARQLKQLARVLGTYRTEIQRYAPGELDFALLIRFSCLSLLSPELARIVALGRAEFSRQDHVAEQEVEFDDDPAKRKEAYRRKWLAAAHAHAKPWTEQAAKLIDKLLVAFDDVWNNAKVMGTLSITERPAIFTYLDFQSILEGWQTNPEIETVKARISDAQTGSVFARHKELIAACINQYDSELNRSTLCFLAVDEEAALHAGHEIRALLLALWDTYCQSDDSIEEKLMSFDQIERSLRQWHERDSGAKDSVLAAFKVLCSETISDKDFLQIAGAVFINYLRPDLPDKAKTNLANFGSDFLTSLKPRLAKLVGQAFAASKKSFSIENLIQNKGVEWAIRSPKGLLLSDLSFADDVIRAARDITEKEHAAYQAFLFFKMLVQGPKNDVHPAFMALVANDALLGFLWGTVTNVKPSTWASARLSEFHVNLVAASLDGSKYPLNPLGT